MKPEELGRQLLQGKVTRLQVMEHEQFIILNYRQQQNWGRMFGADYQLANALMNAFYTIKYSAGSPVKDRTINSIAKDCKVLSFWLREIEDVMVHGRSPIVNSPYPYFV